MGPYQTEVNRQYADTLLPILRTIDEQTALGIMEGFTHSGSNPDIISVAFDNDALGHWAHPFFYGGKIYMDPRPFLNRTGGVKNHSEHEMLSMRAVAELTWATEPELYEGIMAPLSLIFAEWLSGTMIQRYDGTEIDRGNLKVAATAYYVGLFLREMDKDNEADGEEVVRLTTRILSRNGGGLPANYIQNALDSGISTALQTDGYRGIDSLAFAIRDVMSVNLGEFTKHTLIQIMGTGSWIGNDAVILSVMALEHPPTLAAMTERATNVISYRNKSRIGRAINGIRRIANTDTVATLLKHLADY